jgi:uncharacterized protein YqfA (UPF0365 family)
MDFKSLSAILMLSGAVFFLIIFFYFIPIGLFIAAAFSNAYVGFTKLIGMRLRKIQPRNIVLPYIASVKAGLKIKTDWLEAHYLSGGNVNRVVTALITAYKANMDLPFEKAAAIDLAGRDVLEAIKMSVNPKVIKTPLISAVAKDGIQLKATSLITVRTNIDRLIGGAGENTIIARVGEGIVTTIGSAESHKYVLENPDSISKVVLEKGLDSGTAYEILSIDVADVDVGENIGAALQIDQAEADKKVAQAKAEERRAFAVAAEQENIAEIASKRAKLVEAEALIPTAIAGAFRIGNLGIMDYNLKNIQADPDMRKSISDDEEEKKT